MADATTELADTCRGQLWPPDDWFKPSGYPNSLALCIIDAIQSTGSHYASVQNVVSRYRKFRAGQGGDADTDGTRELLATFESTDGSAGWADEIGNRKPASTKRGAASKAEVIRQVAARLDQAGIRTAEDLRRHGSLDEGNESRRAAAKRLWTGVEAQSSGITWEYGLMLAGVPGAKADRMVVRFVVRTIGAEVSPTEAAELVRSAASRLDVNPTHLDHAIWRAESGRSVHQDGKEQPFIEPT